MAEKVKVVYITGSTRSGSTILERILGQIEGFFSVGEIYRNIWDYRDQQQRFCGCGVPVRECQLWNAILDRACGGLDSIDVDKMLRATKKMRTVYMPVMMTSLAKRILDASSSGYLSNVEKLYRDIQAVTKSRVIVDSSKVPSYGRVLSLVPAIDLRIVHLVRDARAVAYSWTRKKLHPYGRGYAQMAQHSSFESSMLWNVWNLASEALKPHERRHYLMIRYEDFISHPLEAVGQILDLAQEKASHLPFLSDHEVLLGATHTIGGNPVRFQQGAIELCPDREWETQMHWSDKALATAVTWPLLIRYGYV